MLVDHLWIEFIEHEVVPLACFALVPRVIRPWVLLWQGEILWIQVILPCLETLIKFAGMHGFVIIGGIQSLLFEIFKIIFPIIFDSKLLKFLLCNILRGVLQPGKRSPRHIIIHIGKRLFTGHWVHQHILVRLEAHGTIESLTRLEAYGTARSLTHHSCLPINRVGGIIFQAEALVLPRLSDDT